MSKRCSNGNDVGFILDYLNGSYQPLKGLYRDLFIFTLSLKHSKVKGILESSRFGECLTMQDDYWKVCAKSYDTTMDDN